jgi:membrane associated rhomboid family serine protease
LRGLPSVSHPEPDIWWEVKTLHVTTAGAIGAWFGEQLLLGLLTTATGLDQYVGIAFWARVGGLVAGVLLGGVLVRLGSVRRYAAVSGPRNPLVGYVHGAESPSPRRTR